MKLEWTLYKRSLSIKNLKRHRSQGVHKNVSTDRRKQNQHAQKISFPIFTKITLSVGMDIYDKMRCYLFSCWHLLIQILLRITDRWQAPQEFQKHWSIRNLSEFTPWMNLIDVIALMRSQSWVCLLHHVGDGFPQEFRTNESFSVHYSSRSSSQSKVIKNLEGHRS